jgi:endonuclease/exonuclease/phosphatase family metal-dependent hydrolase
MTFNLLTSTKMRRTHPWRLRRRSIARIFRHYQPDVVGTQEGNLRQLMELAELLPEYDFVGEGNLSGTVWSGTPHDWYCAIFYRRDRVRPAEDEGETYWLSPTPEIPASQFPFCTRPRVATWHTFEDIATGREFVMGTTHLEALHGLPRRRSAALLRAYVEAKIQEKGRETPLFLTGDFNAVDTAPELQALAGNGRRGVVLYDAWREAGRTAAHDGATFRGLGPWARLSQTLMGPRRIDYVLFRPRLEIVRAERIDFDRLIQRETARPSDHFPVLADFLLPPAASAAPAVERLRASALRSA